MMRMSPFTAMPAISGAALQLLLAASVPFAVNAAAPVGGTTAQTKTAAPKAGPAVPAVNGTTASSAKANKPAAVKSSPRRAPARTAAGRTPARRRWVPPPPRLNPQVVAQNRESVMSGIGREMQSPIENAGALVPFYLQLHKHQQGQRSGPIPVLQYGDSHTAADEWTGALRDSFQQMFGDGGPGYSLAGKPWNGYRRLDVRTGSTRGWYSDGLVGRSGDGRYGLGGVSMSTASRHESIYLQAEGQHFELYYLQQPGGGALDLFDNGTLIERISTDGETAARYYRYDAPAGPHRLEAETVEAAPVRLFGWVAEKAAGVTYETLGINGAEASIVLGWDQDVLNSNLAHRNPALLVVAYGTNEGGHSTWTEASYQEKFEQVLRQLRAAAPASSILVIGPLDRNYYSRPSRWQPLAGMDRIVEAQRAAARATGCAFWDQRARMGGKGSIDQWVHAGLAQADHVHLTSPGYRAMADAMFRDMVGQYNVFLEAYGSLENEVAGAPQPSSTAIATRMSEEAQRAPR